MSNLPHPDNFIYHHIDFKDFDRSDEVQETTEQRLKAIAKTIEWYDSYKVELHTFRHPPYSQEATAITPLWVFKQAAKEDIAEFKALTTLDVKNSTLVVKIHDYQNNLISYKRRRFNGGKWVTAKATHPNKQCLVRRKENLEPIIIVEGHHDYLTALIMGFNVLMVPTVAYNQFTHDDLSQFKDYDDVFFIPDLNGDDNSSLVSMRLLAKQLTEMVQTIRIINLKTFLKANNIPFSGDKLDLSQVVELYRHESLESFMSRFYFFCDGEPL